MTCPDLMNLFALNTKTMVMFSSDNIRKTKLIKDGLNELINDFPDVTLEMYEIFEKMPKDYSIFEKEFKKNPYGMKLRFLFDSIYDEVYPPKQNINNDDFDQQVNESEIEDANDNDNGEIYDEYYDEDYDY
jgi:hypothetical protein